MSAIALSQSYKPVTSGIRRLTLAISALAFVVGPLLFLLPDRTETLFAWTINPPLTAAFLGGAYSTALVVELVAARTRLWAHARVVYLGMSLFTLLTLIATLLHIDRFHFNSDAPFARLTAYAWVVIYIAAPLVMLVLLAYQVRQKGGEPTRRFPLPSVYRMLLVLEAAVMVIVGVLLFIAPQTFNSMWPWALTPLTGRAVGAWLIGLGVAAAHGAYENDWERILPLSAGNIAFGALQLISMARFASTLNWGMLNTGLYVLGIAAMLALGLAGWFAAQRSSARPPVAVG
ncbi:MAG: hypothetical protein WCF84_21295 [Anaerolineae bacterium]